MVSGMDRSDEFYRLAKELGYRSRSAFKLTQLDAKYSFLSDAHAVLDLCAAPGGWMQVVVQRIPLGSLVVGVDLYRIRPLRGAFAVQEDIAHSNCRSTINSLLADNHVDAFDVILHDGSPNVAGGWIQEVTLQNALVVHSLKLATEFLAPNGTFVTKIFRSQDYDKVLFCLRQLFEKVEVTKPEASRSTLPETFIVCQKYKAPAKIDPYLLDIKHLFKEPIEPEKVIDVLRDSKKKRSRGGYEDDLSLVSKDRELTIKKFEALLDDLSVLVEEDLKRSLKLRVNIRKALSTSKDPTATCVKSMSEPKDDEGEVSEDEKILNEMDNLTHNMEVKKKREKKILAKRRAKEKTAKQAYEDAQLSDVGRLEADMNVDEDFDKDEEDSKGTGLSSN